MVRGGPLSGKAAMWPGGWNHDWGWLLPGEHTDIWKSEPELVGQVVKMVLATETTIAS